MRGNIVEITKESGVDKFRLGRWNWVDLIHDNKCIWFIIVYQYIKLRQTCNTVCDQHRYYLLNNKINVCLMKVFRDSLSKLI